MEKCDWSEVIRELGLGIRRTKQWLCEVVGDWRPGAIENNCVTIENIAREHGSWGAGERKVRGSMGAWE